MFIGQNLDHLYLRLCMHHLLYFNNCTPTPVVSLAKTDELVEMQMDGRLLWATGPKELRIRLGAH